MFKLKLFVCCFLLSFFMTTAFANQTGGITGGVLDYHSGQPLPDANIIFRNTPFGVASNYRGFFRLTNIPAGKYTVEVSRIGYESKASEIQIAPGQTVHLSFALKSKAVRFGEILVTATRESEVQTEVAVATEIITRSEMENSGAENVGEALENAAGLFLKNYGGVAGLKTASIRGASENQVLILLDGQRLNQAQGLSPDLSDIPLQALERIEIVRGGHSALYGTDAVGGVINLITRSGRGPNAISGGVNSTLASFGTRSVEANFSQTLGALDYFVAHNYMESDGDFEFEDAAGQAVVRSNNDLKLNDTFLKLRYRFRAGSSLSGYFQFHDADRGAPGPLSFPSEAAVQQDRSWKYNLRYEQQIGANLNFRAQTFYYNFKQTFDDASSFFPIFSQHENDGSGLSLQSSWRVLGVNHFTGGYEFREDKANSTDIAVQKRTIHSTFFQDQIRLPLQNFFQHTFLNVIPAVRLDRHSDQGTQVSPKLGFNLNYSNAMNLILRGSWGRSYRIPSFNELYWPAGPFTAGNPNLLPEKGQGYDLGVLFNFRRLGYWGFEVNYFATKLDNLILWGPDPNGVWAPQNVQKARIQGVESKISYRGINDRIYLEADYNYLDAVDRSENALLRGKALIYRPEHKFAFDAHLDLRLLALTASHQIISRRFTSADNSASLKGYSVTNIGAVRTQKLPGLNLKLQFQVRNLFDKNIQVIEGYPVPGREYRTSIGLHF